MEIFLPAKDATMTNLNTFKLSRLLILAILAVVLLYSEPAGAQSNIPKAQEREKALKNASSTSDSLRILLDVYTLSDKVNRDRVRGQILTLAEHSDNNEVINDVLKELSKSTDMSDQLARLIEISESIPDHHRKKNVHTVLVMEQANNEAANATDSNLENQMVQFTRQGLSLYDDPYKEIQNIYRAMVYLGTSSQGPLYFEYIKRLEELINQLPEEDHAIRNLYYTTAAIFYTRKRDYKKAIETDRKLIQELDKLKALYKNPADADKDLNYFYYVSYRRMLRNFKGLTPQEIEQVYQKCRELAEVDQKAGEEFATGGLVNSYYFMATKQYAKAVPELRKALNAENISDFRKAELLGHLAFALRKTGDEKGELETLREYTKMLLQDRANRRDDMYKEIELRNSVNKIINEEYQAQELQRQQNGVMRKTSITIVYALGIILIFLCGSYLRLRRKVRLLEAKNNKLHKNIEHIFDDGVPSGTQNLHHKYRLKG